METIFDPFERGLSLDDWEDEGGSITPASDRVLSPPDQRLEGSIPFFVNDIATMKIGIGVSAFKCIGASPPGDHPHVYLDMGTRGKIICPYCATCFWHDWHLGRYETEPPGCLYSVGSRVGAAAWITDSRTHGRRTMIATETSTPLSEEAARYGINRVPVDLFEYGGYRYTNLEDAIAEAKRREPPTGGS